VLPVLGDDLSGFAARVKEARQRLGFSIADVGRLGFAPFNKREWLQWEAAEDEPDYDAATVLIKVLEVSPEWLFTDTEPSAKPAKPGRRFQADLYAGEPRDFSIGPRLKAAREAAGLSRKDVALLTGRFLTLGKLAQLEDGTRLNESAASNLRHHVKQYVAMFAQLYGVPLETLLYHDAELIILRRRVERLRRRFGLPSPPGERKADAA
jgi:transcriptional regulator with XRE-family HTH domain